jgi:hypothetical protein
MKNNEIREFFNRAYSFVLNEQDDPFAEEGGDEEADEEEGGDEEGGDDPFAEEEEGGDEEGGDEEGGDEEAEEDEGPKADEEDEVRFSKSLDDQLQAIFIDIESDSIKSAQVQAESYSLRRLLLIEQEGAPALDADKFAAETARLIKNFDAFFDVEGAIQSKARSFLLDKYGEETADEVSDLLSQRHDIRPREEEKAAEVEFDEQVPIAVGATAGGGGP